MIEALLPGLLARFIADGITAGALVSVYPAVAELFRRHSKGWTTKNYQVERVACRSFYAAMTSICGECMEDSKTKLITAEQKEGEAISEEEKRAINAEIELLAEMQRDSDWQLKNECKKAIPTVPDPQIATPLLFAPDGTLSDERRLQLKHDLSLIVQDMLDRRAGDENTRISCCPRVRDTLYERMCACFAFELKHNTHARHVFEREILSDINARMRGQEITSQQIAQTLEHVADTQAKMLERLTQIERAINQGFDTHFESLLNVLTSTLGASKTSFEETQLQLRLLSQSGRIDEASSSLPQDTRAFFIVERDEWKPLRKSERDWLNHERPAVIGRKTEDNRPDIWFTSPYISRTHATVTYNEGTGYALVDTSTNGTTVNGVRIAKHEPRKLTHGDRIGLADDQVVLFFCTGADIWETFKL